jgi:acetyl-CoA carboxylase / biotin carboxylase 1
MAEVNGHGANVSKTRTVPVTMNGKATYAEKHKIASHFIGGNKLENAPETKVKEFVAKHDGHTVITNVSAAVEDSPPFSRSGH